MNHKPSKLRLVAITQPYVAPYRVPLWQRVHDHLASNDCQLRVFWGHTQETLDAATRRGDLTTPDWSEQVPITSIPLGPRVPNLIFHRLPRGWRRPNVLITEMQVANLNAWLYPALGVRVITFGHGVSSTTTDSAASNVLESLQNRMARHVLTYTDRGAQQVIARAHISNARVTAFRNATDTHKLESALEKASAASERHKFRKLHKIDPDARIVLYIGALEKYKQVDLVASSFRELVEVDPNWHLVVAGAGSEVVHLERLSASTGRVTLLGRVGPSAYAPAAVEASAILNPGRIGLLAVDALTAKVPIVTTIGASHAPEFEYLRQGMDVIEVEPTSAALARACLEIAARAPVVDHPSVPNVRDAADRISAAILKTLE